MNSLDCVIVGAGPAGLSAAIYLARYRRRFMLFDDGNSRASLIPAANNYPGELKGISGVALLNSLKKQIEVYSTKIIHERIISLECINEEDHIFKLASANHTVTAPFVVLATGVQDISPKIPSLIKALQFGLLRYCPICDAYEIINKQIAVLTDNQQGLNEALFLKTYSPHVTVLISDNTLFSLWQLSKLKKANIKVIRNARLKFNFAQHKVTAITPSATQYHFDTLYSALGCMKTNTLAIKMGAKSSKGEIIVNKHQRTSIPGLYAIGDTILGLNQLCVAQSQGAIAATHIHNHC